MSQEQSGSKPSRNPATEIKNKSPILKDLAQGACKCKKPEKGEGRNLVVCVDGTSNQFGQKNTNLIELYSQLLKNAKQITFYNSGIGTYVKPSWKSYKYWKQVAENKIDLAIAWNFDKIVRSAYRWLSDNYEDGDRIFLFGFSRGAYQVRALAGMIAKVGLIYKGNEDQIPFAYELYIDPTSSIPFDTSPATAPNKPKCFSKLKAFVKSFRSRPNTEQNLVNGTSRNGYQELAEEIEPGAEDVKGDNLASRFKATFSRKDVNVHFIGVWDTVSSVGIIRGKNLPGTDTPDNACYFRHALALDERRVKFLPEYAYGGVSKTDKQLSKDAGKQPVESPLEHAPEEEMMLETDERTPKDNAKKSAHLRVKEVWFPGTHSDIGGGNVKNEGLDRRHPAFLWMAYEAIFAGLSLNPSNVEWKWDELGVIHESLTGVWSLFEWLPFKRLSYNDSKSQTWRPHKGGGRKIQPGQLVHASVAFCPKQYHPKALLPPATGGKTQAWSDLVGTGEMYSNYWTQGWEDLLETDIFDLSTAKLVIEKLEQLSEDPTVWVHRLTVMSQSEEGRSTLQQIDAIASRLVNAVQNRDTAVLVAVADAIVEFGDDDMIASLVEMFRKDGKSQLVQFLCNGSSTYYKYKAVQAMTNDDNLHQKMLTAEFFTGLQTLLMDPKEGTRQSTVWGINQLARHDDFCQKILEGGFVKQLFGMLKDKQSKVCQAVVNVMTEFTKYDDIREQLSELNFINNLLYMFKDTNELVCQAAVMAVTELLKYDDTRKKLSELNFIHNLLDMLKNTSEIVRWAAIDAITEATRHDETRKKLSELNFISNLLDMFRDTDVLVCCTSIEALTELSKYDDTREKLLDLNFINHLLDMFKDTGDVVRLVAVKAVTEVTKYDASRKKLSELNFINNLFDMFKDANENVCQAAVNAITELSKYDEFREQLSELNFINHLLNMFKGHFWKVRQAAIKAVVEVTKYDSPRKQLSELNFINSLLDMFKDTDEDVRQTAVEAIAELSKHEDFRMTLLQLNFVNDLLNMFNDPFWQVRQAAVDAVAKLMRHENALRKILELDISPTLSAMLVEEPNSVIEYIYSANKDIVPGLRQSICNAQAELAKHDPVSASHSNSNVEVPGI